MQFLLFESFKFIRSNQFGYASYYVVHIPPSCLCDLIEVFAHYGIRL
jgi:hypothetical protein